MKRQIVETNNAPVAVGPFSQATKTDEIVFTSGQIGINPLTGNMVEGGIEEQVRQVLKNLKIVLEAAGASLETVMKTTVYLANIEDFAVMNKNYKDFFPGDPPARSTVQVAALALGALVEIEAIAVVDKSGQ